MSLLKLMVKEINLFVYQSIYLAKPEPDLTYCDPYSKEINQFLLTESVSLIVD